MPSVQAEIAAAVKAAERSLADEAAGRGPRSGLRVPVTVVVMGRDYGRYLGDCLASVGRLDPAPAQVVYVDNGSADDSLTVATRAGVEWTRLRVGGTPGAARNRGAEAARSPWLVFLDADDLVPTDYLGALYAEAADGVDVVYPRVVRFGVERGLGPFLPEASRGDLLEGNWIPVASLVRREAFDAAGGWGDEPYYQDWALWLAMQRGGGRLVGAGDARLLVRTHPGSLTSQVRSHLPGYQSVLRSQPLTVFSAFGPDRPWLVEAHCRRLLAFAHRRPGAQHVLVDNTCDGAASASLRRYAGLLEVSPEDFLEDRERVSWSTPAERAARVPRKMAALWEAGRSRWRGDFVLSWETDVEPSQGRGPERLYEGFAPDVAAVSGLIRSRQEGHHWLALRRLPGGMVPAAWPGGAPEPPQDGCVDVDACGVGLFLFRRHDLAGCDWPTGGPGAAYTGHDFGLCAWLAERGRRVLLHCGARCRHWLDEEEWV